MSERRRPELRHRRDPVAHPLRSAGEERRPPRGTPPRFGLTVRLSLAVRRKGKAHARLSIAVISSAVASRSSLAEHRFPNSHRCQRNLSVTRRCEGRPPTHKPYERRPRFDRQLHRSHRAPKPRSRSSPPWQMHPHSADHARHFAPASATSSPNWTSEETLTGGSADQKGPRHTLHGPADHPIVDVSVGCSAAAICVSSRSGSTFLTILGGFFRRPQQDPASYGLGKLIRPGVECSVHT